MSPDVFEAVDPASLAHFDMIIDTRSPAEFADDHIPGAVNLPVLDNDERAVVGTIYVRESRFLARRIGAAMVARNVARHLDTALADQGGSFKPLVYCWRGGQRSNSMALILAQVGWRTAVLRGGYKTYRRWVQHALYDLDLPHRFVLLDGQTGSGKTALLQRLDRLGVQTLDLEGLARHRGSLFGAFADDPQPSQKMFESLLLNQLKQLDPARPVVVEAESSTVGMRVVPPAVWKRMAEAPCIEIAASPLVRARYLVSAYADVVADRPTLDRVLSTHPLYPGRKTFDAWSQLADAGEFIALAEAIMSRHYDPAYARSRKVRQRALLGTVQVEALDDAGQARAADAIASLVLAG